MKIKYSNIWLNWVLVPGLKIKSNTPNCFKLQIRFTIKNSSEFAGDWNRREAQEFCCGQRSASFKEGEPLQLDSLLAHLVPDICYSAPCHSFTIILQASRFILSCVWLLNAEARHSYLGKLSSQKIISSQEKCSGQKADKVLCCLRKKPLLPLNSNTIFLFLPLPNCGSLFYFQKVIHNCLWN